MVEMQPQARKPIALGMTITLHIASGSSKRNFEHCNRLNGSAVMFDMDIGIACACPSIGFLSRIPSVHVQHSMAHELDHDTR
jgi:hypothetical protein